jgi:membrane-bound serine protease (ClpP class)
VIGGISLILAFFALQTLPINYAGLLLILFGIALLIAEIKVVSHGILAIGGVVALALGSIMLFDAPELDLRVSWAVIAPTVGITAGVFLFMIADRARIRAPVRARSGAPALSGSGRRGARARCLPGPGAGAGRAVAAVARGAPVAAGARVRVVDVQGLTLTVEPAGEGGA